jgi:hypothetical protein
MDKFGVQEPEGWVTQNFLSVAGADSISCISSNSAAHGFKSARLRAVKWKLGDTTYFFSGSISQIIVSNARPKSYRFFYKAIGDTKDTFYASLAFYKGSVRDMNTVGTATAKLPLTNQWTAVEVNVDWTSNDAYDTAILGFIAPPRIGAELYIDNVDLSEYGAGLRNIEGEGMPFFVHHRLQIPATMQEKVNFATIINLSGQSMFQGKPDQVNVSELPSGNYVLSLFGENRKILYSVKFLKQ